MQTLIARQVLSPVPASTWHLLCFALLCLLARSLFPRTPHFLLLESSSPFSLPDPSHVFHQAFRAVVPMKVYTSGVDVPVAVRTASLVTTYKPRTYSIHHHHNHPAIQPRNRQREASYHFRFGFSFNSLLCFDPAPTSPFFTLIQRKEKATDGIAHSFDA